MLIVRNSLNFNQVTDNSTLANPKKVFNSCVLTLGNFDGLHLGHQKILNTLKAKSKELDLPLVLISFYPHPLEYIKGIKIKNLTTFIEKQNLLNEMSIDYLYLYRFNKLLKDLSAKDFLLALSKTFNPAYILVGSDAKVGANRVGDVEYMKNFFVGSPCSFNVAEYQLNDNQEKISSSEIRELINLGLVEKVSKFLGRKYSFCSRVISGDKRGRTIGFRTANLRNSKKLMPPNGVYITKTKLNGKLHNSISNIGVRPTFNKEDVVCETHLLDYKEDSFYGKKIEVFFEKFLRAEIKFSGVNELKAQIKKDCLEAKKYHDKNN